MNTVAEKRGLYNLIVSAPTTPEMIWKEKRQDNDILQYWTMMYYSTVLLVSTVRIGYYKPVFN